MTKGGKNSLHLYFCEHNTDIHAHVKPYWTQLFIKYGHVTLNKSLSFAIKFELTYGDPTEFSRQETFKGSFPLPASALESQIFLVVSHPNADQG